MTKHITSRRQFLVGAGTAATVAAAGAWPTAARAASEGRPPNIVFVLADDLGFGELGAYGQQKILTPHIDSLAAEGVRFTDCYAGGPVCAPSRCSLLTGLHIGHGTVRENPDGDLARASLKPEDVTFGEVLRAVGYRTACIGKWGFGFEEPNQPSHPNERGFDEFFGYITHTHAHDYYPTYLFNDGDRVLYPENEGANVTYAPDLFMARALEFIERNRDQPFLLFFNPTLPHSPHDVPSDAPYGDMPWTAGNKRHAAQITLLDTYVGRLVERLRELGLDDNTIVMLAGDNGPHEEGGNKYDPDFFDANGPLRGYKRNLYEGGIRVPMIAWSPRLLRRSAGTVCDQPWAFWDVFPTLADFAGAPVPGHLDGRSARALLVGGRRENVGPLYFYRRDKSQTSHANATDGGRMRNTCEAARYGDWKAVRFAPGRDRYVDDAQWDVELYNLATDVGETTNLAARHPEVAAALVGFMRDAWVEAPYERPTWSPEGLAIDVPPFLVAGGSGQVVTELSNHHDDAFVHARLSLEAPTGWTVTPISPLAFSTVPPGRSVRSVWKVVPPPDSEPGVDLHALVARATYQYLGRPNSTALADLVTVAPPAPGADGYLSDLAWISASNGWGPVERDMSNGEQGAGDGAQISIRGTTYAKGLGVHGESVVLYYLGGMCDRFTADVGLDDWSALRSNAGSVAFYVFADDREVFSSGVLTKKNGPVRVNLPLTGVQVLKLVVTNAAGTAFDHASWADAYIYVRK
ncbi:sulfatase-like hydrolase/transferase [Micromonospora sp. SL1-18]|uniref:sulfatase-like hydrolase/transferase n=1 Tax=Micromonospora sp. SL1-18 TaxID=3399128 RepID=UPI003A4E1853